MQIGIAGLSGGGVQQRYRLVADKRGLRQQTLNGHLHFFTVWHFHFGDHFTIFVTELSLKPKLKVVNRQGQLDGLLGYSSRVAAMRYTPLVP